MNLASYMKDRQALVDRGLNRLLPAARPLKLHRAMRYSLLAGGKRLRPLLLMASAECCGTPAARVLEAACAFECLHTYSLIHDDLPALDNDDLRRGRPTCHKAFDEATAILAGDGLLTFAFELLARCGRRAGDRRALEAVALLARAAGSRGMIGGQTADLEAEGRRLDAAGLSYIHTHKTGDLLTASVECGAVLAGAPPARRAALRDFGRRIGLAFQIADDILNVEGSQAKLGKKVGSDAELRKATYPALFGVEKSKRKARQELQAGLKRLEPFGRAAEPLRALARFVVERDH